VASFEHGPLRARERAADVDDVSALGALGALGVVSGGALAGARGVEAELVLCGAGFADSLQARWRKGIVRTRATRARRGNARDIGRG